MQYRKIKIFVGIFVTVLLLTVVASGLFLLREKGFFQKRYSYYFVAKSASAFHVGMPLQVSGFDIGSIEEIALNDDATVLVRFVVNAENKKWISKGTVLVLKKPLIGSPHIEVDTKLNAPQLQPNTRLELRKNDDINDLIERLEPVVNKLVSIIDNIDKITKYLTKDDSDLMKTMKNLELFSRKLAYDDSLLTTFTGDKEATKSVVSALKEVDKTTQNITAITAELQKLSISLQKTIVNPSSEAIQELDAILKDVHKKLQKLDGTVDGIATSKEDIEQLKESIGVVSEKTNEVLQKVDAMLGEDTPKEVELP